MILKLCILIWGIIEIFIGGSVAISKKLLYLKGVVESLTYINNKFDLSKVKDIKKFSVWVGETVLIEGGLYIFLSSASIYFELNNFIVLFFIVIIEFFFFNVIIKGVLNFIEE
ncbi:hypothetical protein [Clostridium tertium]|uniref:Uncharacterized protein n=1 Tax=Clostridium tertium TaxID=1559 RepID=A0A6N3C398_9CLOT